MTAASTAKRVLAAPSARLLSRMEAAAYTGVSATTFDKMVNDRIMPQAKRVYARVLWDVRELDAAIDALPGGEDDSGLNEWDNVLR